MKQRPWNKSTDEQSWHSSYKEWLAWATEGDELAAETFSKIDRIGLVILHELCERAIDSSEEMLKGM